MKHRRTSRISSKSVIAIVVALLVIGGIAWYVSRNNPVDTRPVTIILAPNYEDAVLSLGGLIASTDTKVVVANFFTAATTTGTTTAWDRKAGFKDGVEGMSVRKTENEIALRAFDTQIQDYGYYSHDYGRHASQDILISEMEADIQALIASFGDRQVSVYGPSIFNDATTPQDHLILHYAYLDIAKTYPQTNTVEFYFYEDYPHVEHFTKVSPISLAKNLENDASGVVERRDIPLTEAQVDKKISALKKLTSQIRAYKADNQDIEAMVRKYTETRCGTPAENACEVVYKLLRF